MFTSNRHILKTNKGFSLIELLLVVFLIGILCQSAVSVYSDLTNETALNTINDEIEAFFIACKKNAKMRHISLGISFNGKTLSANDESNLYLRLNNAKYLKLPEKIFFSENGDFIVNGKLTNKLVLPIVLNNGKIASISLSL